MKRDGSRPVPLHLRNAPTRLMKELGYGKAYRYAHDEPEAYAAGEDYLPEDMPEVAFYEPTPRGLEGPWATHPIALRSPGGATVPIPRAARWEELGAAELEHFCA